MTLPTEFLESMRTSLSESDYEKYLNAMNGRSFSAFRVNSLKITAKELFNLLKSDLNTAPVPVAWCKGGFYYEPDALRLSKLPAYHAGLYYLQEPSAMAAAEALHINEHDFVLDLCAAPGGKTLQAAAALHGTGLIVSNDISTGRCKALIKNIEMAGVTNAVVTNESPDRLKRTFASFFDKIIVDAPCSGEGMFRKNPDLIKDWTVSAKRKYAAMQKEILNVAADLLAVKGEILYSTCTFAKEENEDIVNEFLNEHIDFEVIQIPIEHGFEPSLGGEGFARLFPHKINGEGHFLARLRKTKGKLNKDEPFNNLKMNVSKDKISDLNDGKQVKNIDEAYTVFEKFCAELLNEHALPDFYSTKKLVRHENSIFLVSEDMPDLIGLRVMRSGFYLGDLHRDRFEPSQAFAMGLRIEQLKNPLCLERNDERILRYLKGESFEVERDDGWTVVCLEKWTLGFGKVQNGRLKNKYSTNWKME